MKKGFSLIEILVSVAIIGILSGIGIQTFIASRERARLEEDVAKVVRAIRRTQNSALAPSRSSARSIGANQQICAIKLMINDSGDISTNYSVITTIPTGEPSPCGGTQEYGSLKDKLSYTTVSGATFEFQVPFATTSERSITLIRGGGTLSKKITVTNTGLIKVE
jgi:prepilin-type N-terminal cleavage/methylation domain-containing protein